MSNSQQLSGLRPAPPQRPPPPTTSSSASSSSAVRAGEKRTASTAESGGRGGACGGVGVSEDSVAAAMAQLNDECGDDVDGGGRGVSDVGGLIAAMNRTFDFQREDDKLASSDSDSELDDYGSSCGDSDGCAGGEEGLDQMIADRKQRALRQQMKDMRGQQKIKQQEQPTQPPPPLQQQEQQQQQKVQKAKLAPSEDFDL